MSESAPASITTLHTASEEDLACRARDGCADCFNELAKRLQPRLLFVLQRRVRDHADAEDLVQKTLLRAYEKISLYDPARKFSPWLFTIALRLAADHHRKSKLPTETGESTSALADPAPSPTQRAIQHEDASNIWVLAEGVLKPDQWSALWLLYGEGHSVREIAKTLRRTTVSVRVMLYRARKSLAPHLAAYTEITDSEKDDMVTPTVLQFVRAES